MLDSIFVYVGKSIEININKDLGREDLGEDPEERGGPGHEKGMPRSL
ncbi:hypothetical protein [Arthrobacter sp. StoSoilB22]|nr:hypothetical protein [Arthrobacter sp. StoSoilB22]